MRLDVLVLAAVAVAVAAAGVAAGAGQAHESGYWEECVTQRFEQTAIVAGAGLPVEGIHLHRVKSHRLEHIDVAAELGGRRTLVLGVPFGLEIASLVAVRGFVEEQVRLQVLGIERVLVVVANGAHEAFPVQSSDELGGISFSRYASVWADSDLQLAKALGLVDDARVDGLGITSLRYVLLVEPNMDVTYVVSEPHHTIFATAPDRVFADLAALAGASHGGHDEL